MNIKEARLEKLFKLIQSLDENRLHWVERVIDVLISPRRFVQYKDSLLNSLWLETFGDALMIHHAFSKEPFTKDKFEHAIVNTARLIDLDAEFAPRGNRGYDVSINSIKYSLKTQADKGIKPNIIWISKYMELGKGAWSDDPNQLKSLVESFIEHLSGSDKILILRCLEKEPVWKYELVEIPKSVLHRAVHGELEMKTESKQSPKPGYCRVKNLDQELEFCLYFDGGSERKLQIQGLKKSLCQIHAEWVFEPQIK